MIFITETRQKVHTEMFSSFVFCLVIRRLIEVSGTFLLMILIPNDFV